MNSYCYFSQGGHFPSMLSKISSVMVFDQSSLLSDQYYVTISQLLMSYELPNYFTNKATGIPRNGLFKELVNRAFVRRVGRLLPYYWM
jgi:hypothetical protein